MRGGVGLPRDTAALVVLFAVAAGVSGAAPSSRALGGGSVMLKNGDGMCLNQPKKQVKRGGVHMWYCGKGNGNTRWYFDSHLQQIRSRHGVCLDAELAVRTHHCDPARLYQRWQLDAST